MNTSYKIALAAAVLLCVLVVGFSVLIPGDPQSVAPPQGAPAPGDEAPSAAPPPLTMSRPQSQPSKPAPPTAPATPQEPPAASDDDDLFAQAQARLHASQQAAPASPPAEPEPVAAVEPEPISEPPVAVANQPSDIEAPAASAAPEPSPNTITFGGDTRPAITTTPPTPPSPPAPAPAPPATSTVAPTPAGKGSYTIKSGDTFASVAIALYADEAKWVDIAQANPLVDPRKLKIGQVIRLPGEAELAAAVAPPPPSMSGNATYIVREGDTLSSIAQKFYSDRNLWDVIHRANRETVGSSPDTISAGDKLIIPPKP